MGASNDGAIRYTIEGGQYGRRQRHSLRAFINCGSGPAQPAFTGGRQTGRYLCLALLPALLFSQEIPNLQDTPAIKSTPPKLLYKVEPEYTETARRAGVSGKALLSVVVDVDGHPKDIKVISPLTAGLAEQAIKAVSKWRFDPGTKNGLPVPVKANIEVNFRICRSCTGEVDPTYERLESAREMYNEGVHQFRGDLDKRDVKAAFNSMQKAASLDYAPAEVVLGLFYLDGTGTLADTHKAADWFDRAAAQGNAQGEYQLARLYETGNGTTLNRSEALRMYLKAAEKNVPEAQCAAGMLLEKGDGAPRDGAQALKWYLKSAEQGFPPAQYRVANAYWSGTDGKPACVKALAWALIANSNGEKHSAGVVQEYRAAMTPGQIKAAEREAARFKPRKLVVKQ
jgi:TonB family protein